MLTTTILPSALALFLTTTSTLISARPTSNLTPRSALTVAGLVSIAPTSNTCAATSVHASECVTASKALPAILQSFQTYGISDPATQAAVISTMAFESGDFKYATPIAAGAPPGQGTRNMQSAAFNQKYAQSIPALDGQLAGLGPAALTALLVQNIDYDFGSGAWFLTTQCGASVVSGMKNAGAASFAAYLGCIHTPVTSDRTAYYNRALEALGVKGSA